MAEAKLISREWRDECRASLTRSPSVANADIRLLLGHAEAADKQMEEYDAAAEQLCADLAASEKRAEKAEAEVTRLQDQLDLNRDEFMRIRNCPAADEEIKGLCDRSQVKIAQHVTVIAQRDKAEKERDEAQAFYEGQADCAAMAKIAGLLCIVHRLDREMILSGRTQVNKSITLHLGMSDAELRGTMKEARAAWEAVEVKQRD